MSPAATNLEIADALLHPGPRAGKRSLRPTSDATLRRQSSTDSVGSVVAAWKGAENRERQAEAGPSSSFFKRSRHVKVADSTFTNVAGNNVVHHHYHFHGVTPEYTNRDSRTYNRRSSVGPDGLFAGGESSGESEKDEDSDGPSAQFNKSANKKRKKLRKSIRAPPLSHLSKSEPFRSLKVPKRSSHESLTPIDSPQVQPSMPAYARLGNASQPELSTPNRNSVALSSEQDRRTQISWPRKKIILNNRQVPQVPPPTAHRPTDQDVYTSYRGQRVVNHEYLKIHFWREGRLTTDQALDIIDQATNLFTREANLVTLASPITVCGDTHGQYYDLMQIFEVGGSIKNNRYVFMGNYINHGFFGMETILYLFALKLRYPGQIFLLRGSHECREVAEFFHFRTECLHKYSEEVYEACLRSFWSLPLAALVDDRILCVHGGISPLLNRVDDINSVQRFTDLPTDGLLCDLLWSEPCPSYDVAHSEPTDKGLSPEKKFTINTNQGRGHYYSYAAICEFLARNSLYTIIRGNDLQHSGYNMHQTTNMGFPSVITLFSAPNHLDKHGNLGAVLQYKKGSPVIRTYEENPHPYWLPEFSNVFAWSLPYVNTQLAEMFAAIIAASEIDVNIENPPELRPLAERKGIIKKKILAVGRFSRAMQARREQHPHAFTSTHYTSGSLSFSPLEKDGGFEVIEIKLNEEEPCAPSSMPYSMPDQQDSAVLSYRTSGKNDPSQNGRIWRKLIPKTSHTVDPTEGVVNRRSIIKAKIKAIGRWQRIWKSTSNSNSKK